MRHHRPWWMVYRPWSWTRAAEVGVVAASPAWLPVVARRRGQPRTSRWAIGRQITQHAAEQAADIVVGVDAFSDMGGSLGRSVRGCAGAAQGYLRVGDRVGLVVLGGGLRWFASGA